MHTYSKGWYVKELRLLGIKKHPKEMKHLSLYKTHELRSIYNNEIALYKEPFGIAFKKMINNLNNISNSYLEFEKVGSLESISKKSE